MTTTSPPTLAEQIKLVRDAIAECENGQPYDGVDKDLRDASAILASLEQLETAHSQIDRLMKRLLKSEANERRYLWLRSGGSGTGLYVADAEREWVEVDGEELDELVDDALSAQGGGDG